MLRTTLQILNDIEELFDYSTKEHVLKHAIQDISNEPLQLLVNSINEELTRLHMPYLIKDCAQNYQEPVWIVNSNLNPILLNWNEKIYFDKRGEAVYQKLLEPFKNANVMFPTSLRSAMELFKIDSSDEWQLSTYRDWLIGINTAFYPHECKAIMQKLMTLTVKA